MTASGLSRRVPVSGGRFALVDEEDYELVSSFAWQADEKTAMTYAKYAPGSRRAPSRPMSNVYMHRLILYGLTGDGPSVDHRNGDGLDNRKSNLRPCTASQNLANKPKQATKNGRATSSRYKGVDAHRGRWRAQGVVNGKRSYLGAFATEEAAARAYDANAKREFGDFARVNFDD